MTQEQTIEDLLARLERERVEADRLYNDALTRVDKALQSVPRLPELPAPYDTTRLADLNAAWELFPDGPPSGAKSGATSGLASGVGPSDGSLKGRLRRLIWRMVGPAFDTQQRFNAALVDHLNRNAASHLQTARASRELIEAVGREMEALVRFESLLIQSLQTITVYVDSKDRSLGGSDLRQRLALTEQRLLALKRLVEHGVTTARPDTSSPVDVRPIEGPGHDAGPAFSGEVDSITYVGFEDRFRGAQQEIRRRVEDYLPILVKVSDVVDVGCGRGELLSLLGEHGVTARGVDVNAAMVELCRRRGFEAEQADALAFLARQPDGSIGGLVAVQVVEHFAPAYLTRFLETAFHKMRPGAPLILETINPSCWMAFFETYLRDPTHKQAIHAETLKYLVEASGFSRADVQFRSPVSQEDRLVRLAESGAGPGGEALTRLAEALNDHADKLNRRLFSSMDYVVVARR